MKKRIHLYLIAAVVMPVLLLGPSLSACGYGSSDVRQEAASEMREAGRKDPAAGASAETRESRAAESEETVESPAAGSTEAVESTAAGSAVTMESAMSGYAVTMESTAAGSAVTMDSTVSGSAEAVESTAAESLIRDHIKEMSLEDKVSGLFIITPEALTGYGVVTEAGEVTKQAFRDWKVAGLIYFASNIESRDQLSSMLENTADWGGIELKNGKDTLYIPPFLGVDEEGGLVSRVADSGIGVPNVGSMGIIGASGDPEAAYAAGCQIGDSLHELGFNLDFAPDADVLIDPGNQTIGERSFGSDPVLCGQMAARFVDGLHEKGIASCIKHFPGLGDTETDTHTGGAWSSRSLEDYRSAEFLSFGAGMEAGTDMIMVSHLSNEVLTGNDLPATLNKVLITDILRGELGYEGIIITDSFQMGAVTERFDSAGAAAAAIEAGVDIILIPSDFQSARQGILDAVSSGRISEERVDESLFRILMTRYRLGQN